MKRLIIIFILAFVFNLIWENLHSHLYAAYNGGPITEFILVRASIGDAFIITLMSLLFIYIPFFKKRIWFVIPLGVLISVLIEFFALRIGHWSYNQYMPLIPHLNVGLTPVIQLGILGFVVFVLALDLD